MRQTFDKEKVNPSIARLSHSGREFEIVIDPDEALKLRRGESTAHDAMLSPHIYSSVRTWELASKELMLELFKTSDEYAIGERIIKEGELHFNEEYKNSLREKKKSELVSRLAKEAADLNTGLPFSEARLHSALSQAKVHIDLFKSVDEQLPGIVERLRPVIALTLETKVVSIRVPSKFAPKLYGFISSRGRIVEQAWMGDGALSAKVELPAGAAAGFLEELKKSTHGDVEATVEKKK